MYIENSTKVLDNVYFSYQQLIFLSHVTFSLEELEKLIMEEEQILAEVEEIMEMSEINFLAML